MCSLSPTFLVHTLCPPAISIIFTPTSVSCFGFAFCSTGTGVVTDVVAQPHKNKRLTEKMMDIALHILTPLFFFDCLKTN